MSNSDIESNENGNNNGIYTYMLYTHNLSGLYSLFGCMCSCVLAGLVLSNAIISVREKKFVPTLFSVAEHTKKELLLFYFFYFELSILFPFYSRSLSRTL